MVSAEVNLPPAFVWGVPKERQVHKKCGGKRRGEVLQADEIEMRREDSSSLPGARLAETSAARTRTRIM